MVSNTEKANDIAFSNCAREVSSLAESGLFSLNKCYSLAGEIHCKPRHWSEGLATLPPPL